MESRPSWRYTAPDLDPKIFAEDQDAFLLAANNESCDVRGKWTFNDSFLKSILVLEASRERQYKYRFFLSMGLVGYDDITWAVTVKQLGKWVVTKSSIYVKRGGVNQIVSVTPTASPISGTVITMTPMAIPGLFFWPAFLTWASGDTASKNIEITTILEPNVGQQTAIAKEVILQMTGTAMVIGGGCGGGESGCGGVCDDGDGEVAAAVVVTTADDVPFPDGAVFNLCAHFQ